MKRQIIPFLLMVSLWACASNPENNEPTIEPALPGQAALEQGHLDQALDEIEAALEGQPESGPLWRLLGEARLAFAEDRMAQNSPGFFIQSLLDDTAAALEKAGSLLPACPWTQALQAKVKHLSGQVDEAYSLASEAKGNLAGGDLPQKRYAIERIVAEASFQKYAALKQNEGTPEEEIVLAHHRTFRSLRACEALRPEDPWSYEKQADLFLWEKAHGGVTESLVRGIDQDPTLTSLHQKLQGFYLNQGQRRELVDLYLELEKKHSGDATTVWFLGLSQLLLGDLLRSGESPDYQASAQEYEKSKSAFVRSAALNPQYKPTSDHYAALCDISRGWCLYGARKIEEAKETWFAILRENPDARETPDSFGRNILMGFSHIGAEYNDSKEFELAKNLFKDLSEIDPQDAMWMNNYAFFSREAGTALERGGEPEKARATYEESYAAYSRAVELAPEDARILNDCALILLYHLDRDLDQAEQMFLKAIQLGETARENLDPEEPADLDLPVAIGDAWQNLGVLYLEKRNQPLEAIPFLEKSLAANPGESRPVVQWYLNTIQEMEAMMRFWFPVLAPLLVSSLPATGGAATAALQETSNEAAEMLKKASELHLQGQVNDALDVLDEVDRKFPDLPETNFLYGKVFFSKAQELIRQRTAGGIVLMTFEDAANSLQRSTEQMPKNTEAWILLGQARLALGEFEPARLAAESAIALEAKSLNGHIVKGSAFFGEYRKAEGEEKQALHAKALETFKRAARLNPKDPDTGEAWKNIGDLYAWESKPKEALKAYLEGLAINPTAELADRAMKQAEAKDWAGLFLKALKESEKFRDKNAAENALLFWYLGYSQYVNKDWDGSLKSFRKTVETNEEYYNSWYYIGRLEYAKKNYQASVEAFATFSRKDAVGLANTAKSVDPGPDGLATKDILNFLEGDAYGRGEQDLAREIAHVNALLEETSAVRWNNYAFLCRETGEYESSYQAYLKAVELDPNNPRLLNDCALILHYHLKRELNKAVGMYEKAIVEAEKILEKASGGGGDVAVALRDATNNLRRLRREMGGGEEEGNDSK